MRFIMPKEEHAELFYKTGNMVTLVQIENIITGNKHFDIVPRAGISGNINPHVVRFHGWRGTTDNISYTAMGYRQITKMQKCKNGNTWIYLSDDLKKEEA